MINDIERLKLEISELKRDKTTLTKAIEEKDNKLKELKTGLPFNH